MAVTPILVPGYGANHLELLPLGNTPANVVASSEDSRYPATRLINRHAIMPHRKWQTNGVASSPQVVFDKNQVFNGSFETGDLEGWETGGVITVETSPVHSGTYAAQFGASETEPFALQTLAGRAGEKITVEAALRALTDGTGNVTVSIEQLGLWLDPDGVTWNDSPTIWFTRTDTASFLLKSSHPVLPAYHKLVPDGTYNVTMLIDGDEFMLDSVAFWHWTDLAGLAGHNVHPIVPALEVRASTDNFSANDVLVKSWLESDANPLNELNWPTVFALFTLRGERWWKYLIDGDNDQPSWFGQPILSQRFSLARKFNFDVEHSVERLQRRNQGAAGVEHVHVREDIERRELGLTYKYVLDSQFREFRNQILRRGVFGKHPAVIVYDDTNADALMIARQPGRFSYSQPFMQSRHADLFTYRELAFPTGD